MVAVPTRATSYADAHEHAHLGQHRRLTLPWRAYMASRRVPVVGRLAMLAVEIEAAALATAELRACGVWRPADAVEATFGLASYVFAMFVGAED